MKNLNFCRITIKLIEGADEATFSGYSRDAGEPDNHTINVLNCHNLDLDGHGMKVLDAYGESRNHGGNRMAINIGHASTYIDVHHWDIQNPSGFAGIMAKDSPACENGVSIDIAVDNELFMHHIYIHHNYIHNIPQGEGIYAGDTAFMTGRSRGTCSILYPQKIENVCIYNNFIEEIGLDAIQLGSCITGGRIYDNFCVEYGTIGDGGMSNGIQIGLGNIGTLCEGNFIRQSAERSDDFGHGILCQGVGDNCIRNNIIYGTMESAVYGLERTEYFAGGTGHLFINSDILDGLTGVSVVHNTLMYPAKSVAPTITIYGIRITNFQSPLSGGAVKNNLIIGTSNALEILTDGVTCNDNQIINEGWSTIRDDYFTSFEPYQEDDSNAPYIELSFMGGLCDYYVNVEFALILQTTCYVKFIFSVSYIQFQFVEIK